MCCDACKKMKNGLEPLSDQMRRFLPYKYHAAQICHDCADKLNDEIDKWRNIAWQKAALMLVDMIKDMPTKAKEAGE